MSGNAATRSLDHLNMIRSHIVTKRHHIEVSEPKNLFLDYSMVTLKSWHVLDLVNLICIMDAVTVLYVCTLYRKPHCAENPGSVYVVVVLCT